MISRRSVDPQQSIIGCRLNKEGGGGRALKYRCGHRASLLVPMSTRSSRFSIASNSFAGHSTARQMVDKGGRGLVLTQFFTVGSPFSAIRGARFGSGPRRVTQFRLLLGCGFITDGANFFSSLSFGESTHGSDFIVFKVRSLISAGATIK